ncbi:MAG: FecR family protein [Mangrovibacterium sp.]
MDEDRLIAYICGRMSDLQEKEKVRTWIAENQTNKKLFIRLKNTYVLSRKSSGRISAEQEYLHLLSRTGIRRRKLLSRLLKYAALILLTAGTTWGIQKYMQFPEAGKPEAGAMHELICPPGQISELLLADGTRVWMNAGSHISFPAAFQPHQREIRLSGEAFFDVSPDAERPFLVHTPDITIKVLGTSFNVDAYSGSFHIKTTLVEGKVELQGKNGEKIAEMIPGQLADFNVNNRKLRISGVDTRFYSSWKEGKMTFFNEPLESIVLKLERWYNVQFVFSSEDIKAYRFSGTFLKYKPLEQILEIIKLSSPIEYSMHWNPEKKNKIILKKQN